MNPADKTVLRDEFIRKSRIVHGNSVRYDLVEYTNARSKVTLVCSIASHGKFEITPRYHLLGSSCPRCKEIQIRRADREKELVKDFIKKATETHGDKYTYENVKFVPNDEKVSVTCKSHGSFLIRRWNHCAGFGCPNCSQETKRYRPRFSPETFIQRSRAVHGDVYDYTNTKYLNQYTNVLVTCKKHGDFPITPINHLYQKSGCGKCFYEKRTLNLNRNKADTKETWVEKAIEVHGSKYDYSKTVYRTQGHKLTIVCPSHGEFTLTGWKHLNGQNCPDCPKVWPWLT